MDKSIKNANKKQKLNSYVGTKDFYGDDLNVLNYIFYVWKQVARSFGYQEYVLPLVENATLFKKSGDDLGNKELYEFLDKGDRSIAIRPEATPGVTRMVASFYRQVSKPVRVFSVLNFMRYERPQAGRMREFWQFNVDMFGKNTVFSDIEILLVVYKVFQFMQAPKNSFKILVNSRKFMDDLLRVLLQEKFENLKADVYRIIDKSTKLSQKDLKKMLSDLGVNTEAQNILSNLVNLSLADILETLPELKDSNSIVRLKQLFELLQDYEEIQFAPYIVRGLDYYDDMVFEVFEATGKITRALAGGGRYNSMGEFFGIKDMPAVGFGMGNYTLMDFVKAYSLVPKTWENTIKVYVPILVEDKQLLLKYYKIVKDIENLAKIEDVRNKQAKVVYILGTDFESITKSLRTANKIGAKYVILLAEDELKNNTITVKRL